MMAQLTGVDIQGCGSSDDPPRVLRVPATNTRAPDGNHLRFMLAHLQLISSQSSLHASLF